MKALLTLWSIVILFSQPIIFAQEKSDSTKHEYETAAVTVKELDAFHELLHPLVHEAYPSKDFGTIRKALPNLITSATSLKNAAIPEGLVKKSEFKKGSAKLLKELVALNKKKGKLSDEAFGKKFMEMHDTFEELMGMVP